MWRRAIGRRWRSVLPPALPTNSSRAVWKAKNTTSSTTPLHAIGDSRTQDEARRFLATGVMDKTPAKDRWAHVNIDTAVTPGRYEGRAGDPSAWRTPRWNRGRSDVDDGGGDVIVGWFDGGGPQRSSQWRGDGGRRYYNNSNNNNSRNHNRYTPRTSPRTQRFPIHVASTNFLENMHERCNQSDYKVHAPNCNCSPMQVARATLERDQPDHGVDFNALTVLPKAKGFAAMYLCEGTGDGVDWKVAEDKLTSEIFAHEKENVMLETPFKISCAACLLRSTHPNGFACIASDDQEDVERAVTMARQNKQEVLATSPGGLHADHAIDVACVPFEMLKSGKPSPELRQYLTAQGVHMPTTDIFFGHHIKSLVSIFQAAADPHHTPQAPKWLSKLKYWFVMTQYEPKDDECWLDLSGGKRHLGETAMQCMVRESFEECSLRIDSRWIHPKDKHQRGFEHPKDNINRYFILHPPASVGSVHEGKASDDVASVDGGDDLTKRLGELKLSSDRK